MVKSILLLILALSAPSAVAITADQLRDMADQKNGEDARRRDRANTGALGDLVPGKARSSKYGGDESPQKRNAPRRTTTPDVQPEARPSAPVSGGNIYIPPPRTEAAVGGANVSDAVNPTVAFGIRMGTWLTAKLERKTSSAETGSVEVTLAEDAIGDRRTLPAGSILFLEKQLNSTTRRLEGMVTRGITPSGQEFELRGLIFDPQKQPGLAGVYVIDKKQSVAKGASKGALAAAAAFTKNVTPDAIGAATNAAAESVLSDAEDVTNNNAPQAVIYVTPQTMLIRVERQF